MSSESAVIPVEAIAQAKNPTQQLPDPSPVDFNLLPEKPVASVNAGAYADLRSPSELATNNVTESWTDLAKRVADGSQNGLVAPAQKKLMNMMEREAQNPGEVSTQEMMVATLQVSQATTVSSLLASTVSSVKTTVTTLVERTG